MTVTKQTLQELWCTGLLLRRFAAGDVVSMRPRNAEEDVQQFCQLLRLDPEARFILRATSHTAGECVCVSSMICLLCDEEIWRPTLYL